MIYGIDEDPSHTNSFPSSQRFPRPSCQRVGWRCDECPGQASPSKGGISQSLKIMMLVTKAEETTMTWYYVMSHFRFISMTISPKKRLFSNTGLKGGSSTSCICGLFLETTLLNDCIVYINNNCPISTISWATSTLSVNWDITAQ